jgi:hypothetical protein
MASPLRAVHFLLIQTISSTLAPGYMLLNCTLLGRSVFQKLSLFSTREDNIEYK